MKIELNTGDDKDHCERVVLSARNPEEARELAALSQLLLRFDRRAIVILRAIEEACNNPDAGRAGRS